MINASDTPEIYFLYIDMSTKISFLHGLFRLFYSFIQVIFLHVAKLIFSFGIFAMKTTHFGVNFLKLENFVFVLSESIGGRFEEMVIKKKFFDPGHNRYARPVFKESQALEVKFGLSLQQIVDVVKLSLTFKTSVLHSHFILTKPVICTHDKL